MHKFLAILLLTGVVFVNTPVQAQSLSARGVDVSTEGGSAVAGDIADLRLALDNLIAQVAALVTQVENMQTDIVTIQTDVGTINDTALPAIDNSISNHNTRITTLENQITGLGPVINGLDVRITNLEEAPDSPMADLDVQVVTKTLCKKAKGKFTVAATCPTGYKLLSCSGGSGDLHESYEGYDIRPINNTTCQAIVKEPACYSSGEITARTNLYAYCFKM